MKTDITRKDNLRSRTMNSISSCMWCRCCRDWLLHFQHRCFLSVAHGTLLVSLPVDLWYHAETLGMRKWEKINMDNMEECVDWAALQIVEFNSLLASCRRSQSAFVALEISIQFSSPRGPHVQPSAACNVAQIRAWRARHLWTMSNWRLALIGPMCN